MKIHTAIIKNFVLFKRDFLLFFQTPREFLYSFTYSSDKTVTIQPYNPKVTKLGNEIITMIQKRAPLLKIHFLGSAALKIAGQRDIDLFAACEPKNLSTYLPTISRILGKPAKIRQTFIEWHTEKNNCSIEFLLIDPNSYIFKGPLHVSTILKKNKKLLREYEQLKWNSNGVSIREYKKRRLAFFNRIAQN